MSPPAPDQTPEQAPDPSGRRAVLALLARAEPARLEDAVARLDPAPAFNLVRAPEVGLIMIRGRMGGGGQPFNLGEATVTRCTLRLADGTIGVATILGRARAKARLAALFDALWQVDPAQVETLLLAPLRADLDAEDRRLAEETAATKVDFFTLVRGDD